MTFKIGTAFGASGGSKNYDVTNAAGDVLTTGTTRPGGGASAIVDGTAGEDVYFVLSDGREAGPISLDNPVSDAIDAIGALNIGPGTGARTLTFTVLDADSNPIERATVRVTAGIITKRELTDVNGVVEIPVSDGTWHFAIDKSGYDGVTGTRVVAADLAISATLTAVVVPLPASPDLVTVYGAYGFLNVLEADVPVSAAIQGDGNVFISHTLQDREQKTSTTTGAGGVWSLDLAPLPEGFYWGITIGKRTLSVNVPSTPNTSVNIETIINEDC